MTKGIFNSGIRIITNFSNLSNSLHKKAEVAANPEFISKTGMDYRTWLQHHKKQIEQTNESDCLGSKFEITRKTNSTILEESSKAEEDDDSAIHDRPHHRPTNSKTINPMLLLTNTDQTMCLKHAGREYASEREMGNNIY
jgi:hypothetical protein